MENLIKEINSYNKTVKFLKSAEEAPFKSSLKEIKVNAVIEEISTADEISVGNSMTTFRKYITFEIVDITKVLAEYLSVDTKAINQAIRNGVRDIPGLKIFEKLSTVMR